MSLEWKSCKIGDVVSVRRGSSPRPIKDYVSETGMPWVKIADATKDQTRFINFTSEFIKEEGIEKSVVVNPGDLIVSNSATPGLPKFMNIKACVHDGWLVFDSYNGILKDFLYYYFIVIRGQLVNQANGSVFKNLKTDIVRNFDINLPDLETQKKIVKILSQIDKKIETTIKINKNLEQLMKCIFDDWFVNFNYSEDISFKSSELGEIPSNWNVKKLSDVLITLESGKRPKGGISDIEDGIPSIGAENILGLGKFNYSKNKLISHEFFSTLKKGVIQDNDVLLYKDGAQLGRKSLFMKGFPFDICCINEHVFRLQTNDEINQFYLYLWLDQEVMTNEIINLNSNSAQPGINQNDVKSLPILVPELKIISKFNKIISPMMNQIFDNALEINKLTKLRDTLLPKLMSGEIDVSKINCDLKIIIRKIYIKSSKLFLWRYLSENKNYIKNTKSNETLLKSRTIYQINKFLAKFTTRYRYYRQ